MTMRYILHVNGLDGPLLKQFGCACGRCRSPVRKANVSVSLIGLDAQGNTGRHLLFDIGHGVADSLVDCPYLQGANARLDGLVLTHWHPDHVAELNRLIVSHGMQRRRRGERVDPTPLYCREGTVAWLRREHGHITENHLEPRCVAENLPPGHTLPALPLDWPEVAITPFTVSHYRADRSPDDGSERFSSAGYVIKGPAVRAVLLWDIDSENNWLVEPETAAQEDTVCLLSGAEYLFVDTTFWRERPHRTTHPSMDRVRRYARHLRPRQTFLVHLSGHPDGPGNAGWGWTNDEWTAAARQAWAEDELDGDVVAPNIGDVFELGVAGGDSA